jgi:flagellar assembly protein FliH
LSDAAVNYAFEQLEASDPPPRDAAARLLAQANIEAEQVREQARGEGYADGRAAGHADGLAEISAAARALGEALAGVEALRVATADAVEHDAIEFALSLAEKILAGAFQARPELVVEVVQGALRRINDRRGIEVVVNPADLETVTAAIGDLRSQASGIELCDLQSDQRVALGAAIVRTAEGEVDASVATQLERAREVVAVELEIGEDELEIDVSRDESGAEG